MTRILRGLLAAPVIFALTIYGVIWPSKQPWVTRVSMRLPGMQPKTGGDNAKGN